MAQSVANINASLELDSASFISGAEKARRAMQSALGGIQADVSKSQQALTGLTSGLKGLAIGIASGFGISTITNFGSAVIKAGDTIDQLKLKLNFSVGEGAFTQVALSAQKLGTSVETVGNTMARLGIALKDFGTSREQIQQITETLIEMGRVSGRTGEEIESALTQISQGFSKGKFDGDELKTVLETMPPIVSLLAKELGVSAGELRDLGAEGKITTEVFVNALSNGAAEVNRQFSSLGENLDQSTAKMDNSFQKLFAQIDKSLQSSEIFKFLQGGAAKMADELTAQLEKGGLAGALFGGLATGQYRYSGPKLTELEAAQKKLAEIHKLMADPASALKTSGQGTFLEALGKEALAATEKIDRLTTAVERTEHASANALRAAAKTPTVATVERSLFRPASTVEEERAVNLTKQAFERAAAAAEAAAEETTRISGSAAADRIEIAAETNEKLARLDEERLQDFQSSLNAEIEAEDRRADKARSKAADELQDRTRYWQKYFDTQDEESRRAAEVKADIYAQPFKDLATNLSNTMSDGIQDALSGDFDFSTFTESFTDIFADTLATALTSAIQEPLNAAADEFAKAITQAFSSAEAQAGAGGTAGGGTAGGGMTYGGAAMAGGAFGGTVGAVYGQYGPNTKPGNQAAMGGAIGGALGAGVGFAVGGPIGGLVGAGIGTAVGTGIGSMIGGQNNLGNDRSIQAYRSGRGITYGDTSFSPENRQVTQGILDQVTALQEALKTAGAAIADFGLRIEAGNKTGITVNGKQYPNAQAALAASLEVLIGGTTGMTASQQTVLQTTKAKDAQGIVADLGVATQFDQLTFKGTELTRQLVALDAEMAAFGKRAQALGLDINEVAAAHEKERQALIDAQAAEQNQIRAAIDALAPSGNTLEIQLAQLNDQVQALAAAATKAGLPLDTLAATHQRAAAALISANQQLQSSLSLQVAALDPATDKLGLALAQLNQEVQGLAAQILASGGSLDSLAAAHQRAAADLINQHNEQRRLQEQQAKDEQRRIHEAIKAQQAQARAEAVAQHARILSFQAQVASLEAHPLDVILISIRERFRELIEQGKALGLTAQSEREIRAAQARAESKARADFIKAQNDQILSFQAQVALIEATPLDAALINIRERFRELIDQGRDLGMTIKTEGDIRALQARVETTARNRAKLDQDAFVLQLRGFGAASNDAGLQTAELALQVKELMLRATELGVPLNLVTEAHARATQALKDELALQKANVQDQIAAAAGGTTSLADKLRVLDVEMRQLARAAAGVGIPLSEVTAAHVKAAQRIRDEWAEMLADMQRQQRDATQGILEAQRGAAGAVDQFLNPFKEALSSRGIGQGVYSAASLSTSAVEEFRSLLREARTGSTAALGSLVGVGQSAIQQARQTFGSTAAFADIFREVEAGLREQQGVLEAKRDAMLTQIGNFTRETVDELIRLRVQAIADLRADFAKLSRDLIVAVEGRN